MLDIAFHWFTVGISLVLGLGAGILGLALLSLILIIICALILNFLDYLDYKKGK